MKMFTNLAFAMVLLIGATSSYASASTEPKSHANDDVMILVYGFDEYKMNVENRILALKFFELNQKKESINITCTGDNKLVSRSRVAEINGMASKIKFKNRASQEIEANASMKSKNICMVVTHD